ncbi:MAG: hypothetical protein WCS65_09430 [Verrucomicrobiae bacterium]
MKIRLAVLLPLLLSNVLLAGDAAAPAVDHFQVTDQILQKAPPNFSTNLQFGGFAPWNPDVFVNCWNSPFTAGPILFQQHGQLDAGGEDWMQQTSAPRFSSWDCARSGFWDGSDVYIYRIENGVMKLLRQTKIARSAIGKDPETQQPTEEKIWFADKGPAVQNGDFYVLRMNREKMPSQFRQELIKPATAPLLNGYCSLTGSADWSYDESSVAPEGGSRASLRLDVKEASPAAPSGPWHWFVAHNDGESKVRFKAGKSYKAQIWLRQDGMADPRVQIQFGTVMTRIVDVTPEWKRFEFDLPVDSPEKPYSSTQNESTRMWIGALSPGKLWIDNFLIWQSDVPQFAVMPEEVAIIKDFKPHVVRLWGGLDSPTLDYWLSKGFAQPIRGTFGKTEHPVRASLGETLEVCREAGADPWLVLNPWFTAEENASLMEYLGGPADKGYGKLRADHGHPEPWTKTFNKIYLESANEAWNQMMRYALPSQPETYAAVADRQFRELKKSPYYAADKFEMVANGWDNQMQKDGWSRRVALASKEADRVDVAYYFGGWEKGATAPASEAAAVDEVYQDKLFATALEFVPKILDSATFDPNFLQRFASALRAEPDLLAGGLAAMPAGQLQLTPEQLVATGGNLAALWAKDDKFSEGLKSLIASRRSVLEHPFWHAAYRAMANDPALQPQAVQALELAEPAILGDLTEGLIDFNAPSRLVPLFKAHPDSVKKWAESPSMPPDARAGLEEFLKTGNKLSYNITNQLNQQLRNAIRTLARSGNGDFLAAFRREATPEIIKGKMKHYLNYVIGSTLRESPQRRVEHLMKAMKADPAFANTAMEAIGATPNIFHNEAAAIAATMSANIAQIHSGAESYKPDEEANLLMSALPPDVRKEMWQRLGEAANGSRADLSPESARLIAVMIAAQLGDTAPAKALATDPEFISILESRITESIPVPFLAAAKNDARIGDKLGARLALSPSKTAKKLANYEGGPGYSLPGPGKPTPEEDENIGKSLALGTATLDVSMEFLSAGSSPVAYYDYKTGEYWSSHNNPKDRIAYPSWLALKMRNTLCPGDLLKVDPLEVKRVDVPDKKVVKTTNDGKGSEQTVKGRNGVALTTCHAFRNGGHLTLMLLNRSFTEPRTVSIDLPAGFSGPSKQFALTNPDPKANNRKEENVKIQESAGPDLKSGMQVVVPPASVVILSSTK